MVKYLNTFRNDAIALNRPKIGQVVQAYRTKRIDLADAERLVSLLASRRPAVRERAEIVYKHFLDRGKVGLRSQLKSKRQKEKENTYEIKVILFTAHEKRDAAHIDHDGDNYQRYKKYLKSKYKNKYSSYFTKPKMHQIELFFMYYGLQLLKPGGLMVYLTGSNFLRNGITYQTEKAELEKVCDILDAYRLPPVFKFSQVPTDIIVLKRK
jgi:hypothetical protein